MNRNAVFIAVVLGYSLLELCVAFAMTVPSHSNYSTARQALLALLLLVLIPGLAAIFSGPERLNADYFGQMLGTLEYTGNAPPCPVRWQR